MRTLPTTVVPTAAGLVRRLHAVVTSTTVKVVAALTLLVAVTLAGGLLPAQLVNDRNAAATVDLLAEADRLSDELQTLRATAENLDDLMVADTAARQAVPDDTAVTGMIDHVRAVAAATGVQVMSIDTAAVTGDRVAAARLGGDVVADAITVSLAGPLVGILQAVEVLDDPAATPRVLLWRDVTTAMADAGGTAASATLTGWVLSTPTAGQSTS